MARAATLQQPGEDRAVRVFISSTFKDMQRERDHLVKHVFPRLRELCVQRGVSFTDIDLRWGITSEQAAEGAVLPICLAEIERSRPFFIGILGERYGWIPQEIPDELLVQQPWLHEHLSKSVTELEIVHGVLENPEMTPYAFFYFRDSSVSRAAPVGQRDDVVETDPSRAARLEELKRRIRESGITLHEGYTSPESLGELVLADLTTAIDECFPAASTPDPLTETRNAHEALARELARVYVGGESYLEVLDAHVLGDSPIFVLAGESGVGKSALISRWYLEAAQRADRERARRVTVEGAADPWASVDLLAHFVGVDRDSTSVTQTIRRLILEIASMYDLIVDASPHEGALMESLDRVLGMVPQERRLVILIDAVNQLDTLTAVLHLLTAPLPETVRLVLSVVDPDDLGGEIPADASMLSVAPMNEEERSELAVTYLSLYGKSLTAEQLARVASAPQGQLPVFLVTLLDELRVFGSYDALDDRIALYLEALDTPALFDLVLERWESDYESAAPGLVGDTMRALWAARHGLTEDQLLAVLGEPNRPMPQALFAPLRIAAGRAIAIRSGKIGFAHDYLRLAVERRYLPTAESRLDAHARMVSFYAERNERRELGELVWQMESARHWTALADLLANVDDLVGAWQTDPSVVASAWRALKRQGVSFTATFDGLVEDPARAGDGLTVLVALARSVGEESFAGRLAQSCAEHAAPDSVHLRTAALQQGALAMASLGDHATAFELIGMAEQLVKGTWAHRLYLGVLLDRASVLARAGCLDAAADEYLLVASAAWLAYDERLLTAARDGWRNVNTGGVAETATEDLHS